jgi:hypothetical protein
VPKASVVIDNENAPAHLRIVTGPGQWKHRANPWIQRWRALARSRARTVGCSVDRSYGDCRANCRQATQEEQR